MHTFSAKWEFSSLTLLKRKHCHASFEQIRSLRLTLSFKENKFVLSGDSFLSSTQVTRIIDGGESPEFKTLFQDWRDKEQSFGFGNPAARKCLTPLPECPYNNTSYPHLISLTRKRGTTAGFNLAHLHRGFASCQELQPLFPLNF